MLGVLEPGHLILILLVALLVFGPRKLPELGKSLGASLREFRNSTQELRSDLEADSATHPALPMQVPAVTVAAPTAVPVVAAVAHEESQG